MNPVAPRPLPLRLVEVERVSRARLAGAACPSRRTTLLLACLALAGCAPAGFNYPSPDGPRYAAGAPVAARAAHDATSLRVVSFNVKFARDIGGALVALASARTAGADVLFLQEMDLTGTERIACALGLGFVYYPAALHPGTGRPLRPFGVALLSPWPITDDRKVALAPTSAKDAAQKAALAATVWVDGRRIRVANVHLQSGLTPRQIGPQLAEALAGIEGANDEAVPVVVAGDFNTFGREHLAAVAREAVRHRLTAVLPEGTQTFSFAGIEMPVQLDHVFVRGLVSRGAGRGPRRGSDHYPVWADLSFPGPPTAAETTPPPRDPSLVCPVPIRKR
jgi:endonuclease/exonuclease/phosphatase family metal-dependent hydrolase